MRVKCPDCDGSGTCGRAPDGRLYACERCGGDEDSIGAGYIEVPDTKELTTLQNQLTSMTREQDTAVERLKEAEELLRDFVASTDNAGTYPAVDRVPPCGCCQRENHHPNCPVLRAKAFLTPLLQRQRR